jgi:acetylornithine/succinyldiaminopimelate/putrescine aminotransferase
MNRSIDDLSNFKPATTDTLDLIRTFNTQKRPIFLTSSNYIHAETAKLGYLLSSLLTDEGGDTGPHRTFFLNSGLEALSGAIKLARQTSVRHRKKDGGSVVVVDEKGKLASFFDPTGLRSNDSLNPEIAFVTSINEAHTAMAGRNLSALVLVRYAWESEPTELDSLLAAARRRGAILIACATELEASDSRLMKHGFTPDITVFGENLAGHQLPFGCFTMTEKAYSIWNNDIDCFAQASTFGGNSVCVAAVLREMERCGHLRAHHRAIFNIIESNRHAMMAYWEKYVNPRLAVLARKYGIDLDIRQAEAARLRFGDGTEIIDCCGGFGSNLRGHNPPDIAEILAHHDSCHDYFSDLETLLSSLSKFSHAFPAVSGATAVDIAVSIGMLANPARKKIVTFIGNFSGKTLFGFNLSKYGPQRTASDRDAFRPYYSHLVYIDPFAKNAAVELAKLLREGDVALVWCELIQGLMCEKLPAEILSVVDAMKEEGGYLIGVDEVLTGGWRAGNKYLAHDGVVMGSDIVAIGKTLSDMTLPTAAILVTEAVYRRASQANSIHVQRLKFHYRNQLSAHISLNGLSRVLEDGSLGTLAKHRQAIENGLSEIVSNSKIFADIRGCGSLLRLRINPRYFPFRHHSALKVVLEMAISHLIFVRGGVFVFLLRLLHRVFTTDTDVQELVLRLKQAIEGVTPWMVYRYAVSRMLVQRLPRLASILERGMPKVAAQENQGGRSRRDSVNLRSGR